MSPMPRPPQLPPRKAQIDIKPTFREEFSARNEGLAKQPHPITGTPVTALELALEMFLDHKVARPPRRLPKRFRDHRLEGALGRFRECHLAGDVLLIYRDEGNTLALLERFAQK